MKLDMRRLRTLGLATTAIVALPLFGCSALTGNGNDNGTASYHSAQAAPAGNTHAFASDENANGNNGVTYNERHANYDRSYRLGSRIRDLQQALNRNGASLKMDGIMGPNTRQALRNYQSQNGLKATGRIDQQTRQKLDLASSRNGNGNGTVAMNSDAGTSYDMSAKNGSGLATNNSTTNADLHDQTRSYNTSTGSNGGMNANAASQSYDSQAYNSNGRYGVNNQGREEVREVQEALNAKGASLQVDGVMGRNTRKALRNYQSQNGLQATGTINQKTQQDLDIVSK